MTSISVCSFSGCVRLLLFSGQLEGIVKREMYLQIMTGNLPLSFSRMCGLCNRVISYVKILCTAKQGLIVELLVPCVCSSPSLVQCKC